MGESGRILISSPFRIRKKLKKIVEILPFFCLS